ncbi:MAG: hypothetical protein A2017_09705 [Lentisphaerae bacterium GWF2_44_16]|nr:MAG: hypothetical protein A2017_09705 [Lentisphaerae bacterium GWF2_44_16]
MPDGKPNILLIMTDQHRLSALGAYGETPCLTPNLDALASEGTLFENAYTVCPVCSPARGTIMTGKYPHGHGITANLHEIGCNVSELPDSPELLSRRLESVGYSLGYSGKWHLGTNLLKNRFGGENIPCLPKNVGFEGQNFPGHGGGGFGYPEYHEYLREHGFTHEVLPWDEKTKMVWPAGKLSGPVESTVPYFLAENTIRMMDDFSTRGKPFFIWHNFWGPHGPFYAPGEFIDIYCNIEIPPWPNYQWPARAIAGPHHAKIHPQQEELRWRDWEMTIRYYYAFTTLIDRQIGRIMAHLREKGLLENTVVIFTADHGKTLGSHGGLTDKGWHHFEETHHIPFIMRMPGAQKAARRIDKLISLADVYPTILKLAGSNVPEGGHGASLLPVIDGKCSDDWREYVVTEFNGLANSLITQRTLRCGDWKYGFNNSGEDELYNLAIDPWEMKNIINDPSVEKQLTELMKHLLTWMEETNDPVINRFKFLRHQKLGIETRATV